MTKQKQTYKNDTVGLVNGSMAVAKQAAKVRDVKRVRHFMENVAVSLESEQVLSQSQSPFPVGSQYVVGTQLYAIDKLSPNALAWIQSCDKYRLTQIEVFATLTSESKEASITKTAPVELYFYEDTDADPATLTSWIRVRDRDNIGKVVLNALHPSQRLITFKPTVSLNASAGGAQDPGNFVPSKNSWLDALAANQLHSGLTLFGACPTTDAQGQTYKFKVSLTTRYTVEASQPL